MGAEQDMVVRYGEELGALSSVVARENLLRLILESPTFPLEKKAAILGELMESLRLSDGMKNFFGLLLQKDRLQYLPQIEGSYQKQADELSGVVRARIVSATKIPKAQSQAIAQGLEAKTGKTVKVTTDVDASLIGGIKAEIGGRLFDGSIKTQLKRIEDTLKKG